MRIAVAVAVTAAVALLALGPAGAQAPIKIGVVGPHSGPAAYDGLSTLIGAQVAAKEINEAGGVLGRRVEIVAADSRGIPAESVSAFKKLVTQDRVVGVDCCWFSSSTIATMPTMDELQIPTTNGVSFLPDARTSKLTWLFKFAQTPAMETRFVDYWVQKMGVKRAAFLARNDDWGRATSGVYQARLKELGGTVLSSDFYTPGERDFYSYFTKIKGLNPEGVNIVDVSAVSANLMKQMGEIGITARRLGSDGPVTDSFIKIGGPVVEGVPLVVRYSEELSTPRNQAFVSAFRAMRNGENPDQYAQGGYDSVYLQVEAIRRAGGTDPARVREELRKTNYTSISGSAIRFDGNQQATPKLFVAVVKDGKRIIVQEIDTSGIPY
ncbi:MAG TPA: ABC transporter substrate-binding protein [Candidatus Binatia bacterium]|nr:ABC transporter substrate-binding protein [Candidatus Binatia bacterium]